MTFCLLAIPLFVELRLDVDVSVTGDAAVSLQTMENTSIGISLSHGHCTLHNIKVSQYSSSTGKYCMRSVSHQFAWR